MGGATIMEAVNKCLVEKWVKEGKTYEMISEELHKLYPGLRRGMSARSVRRFCSKNNIKRITEDELDDLGSDAVEQVNAAIMYLGNIICIIIGRRNVWEENDERIFGFLP